MKGTLDTIKVTLGTRKLEFTLEEARTLKKLLNDLEPAPIVHWNPPVIERIIERPLHPALPFWGDRTTASPSFFC